MMVLSVADHSPVAPLSASLMAHRHHLCPCLRHCDHSVSECSSCATEYSLTRALTRRLLGVWIRSFGGVRVLLCKDTHAATSHACALSRSLSTRSRLSLPLAELAVSSLFFLLRRASTALLSLPLACG